VSLQYKILHMDSDPQTTADLIAALEGDNLPCAVQRVETFDALIQAVSSRGIHLIVVDSDEDAPGGPSRIQQIRAVDPGVPVVILSPSSEEEAVVAAVKRGAWDYISKPRLSRLPLSVRRALDEAPGEKPAMARFGKVPYQRIVDTAREGIWVIDASGSTTYANQRMAEMLGVTAEEMLGQSFFSFMDEEGRERAAAHLEDRKQGISEQHEFRFRTRSGEDLWVLISTNALVDESGAFLGALGMVTDITDRRRTEDALLKSEAQLRSMFDNAAIGICLVTIEGRIVKGNPAFLSMLGLDSQEVAGRAVTDIVHSDDAAGPAEMLRELIEGRRDVFQIEHRVPFRRGGELWVNVTLSLVRDEAGAPLFVIVMMDDITERKRLAEQLARSERRFRQLIERGTDLTVLLDVNGSVRYASPAVTSITGYTFQEIVGQPLVKFLPPDDAESLASLERLRAAPDRVERSEFTLLQKSGLMCVVEATSTNFVDDADSGVALNFRDITERRLAEMLHREKEEAERASRAKSEFLSRMSHELRTPMNAILGFAQVLERAPEATPKQIERVQYILNAGKHLLHLINEVLDIARIESGKVSISTEPVAVSEVLREVFDLMQPLANRRGIAMRSEIGAASDYVLADRQQLKQVLLNLVSNAVKYNRDGGSLVVSTRGASAGRVRIGVSDTGAGIPPERMSQLFSPFERLGAERSGVEGAGLGLALSKRLVELMGGAIGAESIKGEGSTFWIELPAAESPLTKSRSLRPWVLDISALSFGLTRTILYIEDNLSNLRLVEEVVTRWPEIRLISAMTGPSGLELAIEQRPDLILLDMNLPQMSGGEVLRRLKELPETRAIPVIIISADVSARQIERQFAAGATGYLQKPLDISLLIDVIEGLLAPPSKVPA
jgi:PAS domain S-box-containing protein